MATEQKDVLFLLIKSLSKSEKRQFSLYVRRLGANDDANFMALFKVIDKMERYDESIILQKTSIKKRQLSNSKAHLYKQLLISLRLNPLHQSPVTQIREQLDFASILYNKGLYKQSLKILDKAKTQALDCVENNLAYEIVEFEKIIESQYITRSISNRADELAIQAKKLSLKNVLTSKLSNLSLQLYSLFLKMGYVKNDDDQKLVHSYFEARLPEYKFENLDFIEKLYLYKAYLWYSFIMQDFSLCYKYAQKWVDLFEQKPAMKQLHPVFYMKGCNYLLEALFLAQHQSKFDAVYKKLEIDVYKNNIATNDNTASLSFLYLNQNKINQFFLKGDFEGGIAMIPDLLKNIALYKNRIDAHHIMVFYYKIACLYFGNDDHKNCILYLDKIISNKELKMREDLLCYSRILNLISHYSAGYDHNIESLIKSTYKFLLKMNELYEVQRKIITFLKNLGRLYPHELKDAFKKLHSELKVYEDHPYEKRAFLYLDILSWLESNIEGVSVGKIVERKMRMLNK